MKMATLLSILLLTSLYTVQAAEQIVVVHEKGIHWPVGGLSFDSPIALEHAKYFGDLYAKGIITQGGPFLNAAGGMMIFEEGITLEEAQKFASEDPAFKKQIIGFKLKVWLRVFGQ